MQVDALPLEVCNSAGVGSAKVPRWTCDRKLVVEQSAEEYSIDESIEVGHAEAPAATHSIRQNSIQRICVNPLREEPGPTVVGAVRRFGIVGLVACAVGTGVARWWRSVIH